MPFFKKKKVEESFNIIGLKLENYKKFKDPNTYNELLELIKTYDSAEKLAHDLLIYISREEKVEPYFTALNQFSKDIEEDDKLLLFHDALKKIIWGAYIIINKTIEKEFKGSNIIKPFEIPAKYTGIKKSLTSKEENVDTSRIGLKAFTDPPPRSESEHTSSEHNSNKGGKRTYKKRKTIRRRSHIKKRKTIHKRKGNKNRTLKNRRR